MTNVIPLGRASTNLDPASRNTGTGEAIAFQIIRLCLSTRWADEAKKKAGLTPERMRSRLAKIIYQIQGLKKSRNAGNVFASLELVALSVTLDMFENNMIRSDILGVDKG